MRRKIATWLIATLAATLAFVSTAQAGQRYIVMAKGNAAPESMAADIAANGGRVVGEIPQLGVLIAESDARNFVRDMSRAAGIEAVVEDALIEFDDPTLGDSMVDHGSMPGSGIFDFLTWGMHAVGAPEAWAAGNRGAGVRVAVLDAGIDSGHPDLGANINHALSASYVPCLDPGDPVAANCVGAFEHWEVLPGFYFNHGTHVSGTIAGTGALGVTGVAPDAELVVVKVCTEFFNACFTSSILAGLVHAADVGADLANMSLGGLRRMRNDFVNQCRISGLPASFCGQVARFFATGQDDYVHATILVYKRAFEYARNGGTTVIVASGNSALNSDTSKDIWLAFADFPHTIAVNALGPLGWCIDSTTDLDGQAYYTNTGQSTTDFSAPGGNFVGFFMGPPYTDPCSLGFITRSAYVFDGVFSTIAGGWGWAQGTSMAAPHATGVAALLISANGGSMSPAQVEQAMKDAAEDLGQPGHDALHGHGRVHSGY